jgi:hypothetical protein
MSLDLDLLPVEMYSEVNDKVWGFSHTVLKIPGGHMYHDLLDPLAEALPDGHAISSYVARDKDDRVGYGTLTTDPYGKPYTFVRAGVLTPLLQEHHPIHPTTKYIEALPATTRVILSWR